MAMKMSPNNQIEDNDNANVGEVTHSGTPKTETEVPEGTTSDAPAPNSAPCETDPDDDTYVYRDFATIPAPSMDGVVLHPQSLQAQKLPAKLASILSDQDLTSVIIWLPHGRSWRVLNRDLFAEHALPRYFGHKNYASFVRIINAWGFRRITRGADRDAYYHEVSAVNNCQWQILLLRIGTSLISILFASIIMPSFFLEGGQTSINA
mmetsp:Transcript_19956/g.37563  ORF Transcript_19956/g.37563 Transcript_19956/m.37563 type:complete len:207 (-) Transcript_19956:1738-2358(-)